jgi:hypothetical protein
VDVNVDVQHNTGTDADITQKFQVNNSSTVKFRFRWESSNAGYAWQVDDVAITSLPDNDIKTSTHYFGTAGVPYYQIPVDQIAPIDMTVNASNVGLNNQEGVYLSAQETQNGNFSDVSPSADINFEMSDSLVLQSSFTPGGIGNYTVEFTLNNDSIDDNTSNNMMDNYNFEVGQYIYARDNGVNDGSISGSYYQNPVVLEPGTIYDIFTNANLTGIDVRLGAGHEGEFEIFGKIYDIDAQGQINANAITETEIYTTSNADAGSLVTLVFPNPVALVSGNTYVISVGAFTAELNVATAGESLNGSSATYGDLGGGLGWYNEPSTPMIRMNFDPGLSV